MTDRTSKLPPLNAIRAFDAVARLGSMAKAASELGVSPSSVTHHLQTLEEFLGTNLVTRTTNSIKLTPRGQAYSEAIRPGFDILIQSTDSLRQGKMDEPLRISCVPTLANAWFAAQMAKFETRYPGVLVHCDFSPEPVRFDHKPVDLAIRYGPGSYADADAELLFRDKIAPVCTPETAKAIHTADDILSIKGLPTTEITSEGLTIWQYWALHQYGEKFAAKVDVSHGQSYQSARFTVEALKASACITVMDYVTVREEINRGTLVNPLSKWVDAPNAYYLLTPKRRSAREQTKRLKAMLKRTIGQILLADPG